MKRTNSSSFDWIKTSSAFLYFIFIVALSSCGSGSDELVRVKLKLELPKFPDNPGIGILTQGGIGDAVFQAFQPGGTVLDQKSWNGIDYGFTAAGVPGVGTHEEVFSIHKGHQVFFRVFGVFQHTSTSGYYVMAGAAPIMDVTSDVSVNVNASISILPLKGYTTVQTFPNEFAKFTVTGSSCSFYNNYLKVKELSTGFTMTSYQLPFGSTQYMGPVGWGREYELSVWNTNTAAGTELANCTRQHLSVGPPGSAPPTVNFP